VLEGVVTYVLPAPHAFDEAERGSLDALGCVLGLALASGGLAQTGRRFRDQVEALRQADVALSEALAAPALPLEEALRTIAEQARRIADARYAALGIDHGEGAPFDPWASVGMPDDVADRLGRSPRAVGVLGLVCRTGQAVRLSDLREHPAFRGLPDGHPPLGAFLGVPVPYGGATVGHLYLGAKIGGGAFTAEDQAAVELFAVRAGVAVRQARLRHEADRVAEADAILAAAPSALLVVEARGGRISGNARAVELFGDLAAARVDELAAVVHRADGASWGEDDHPIARALRGERTAAVEARVALPYPQVIPVLVSAAPVTDEGAVIGAVVVCEDLRAQVELRERLAEERQRLASALENVPVGVVVIERDGRFAVANARAVALVGREIVGTGLAAPQLPFAYPDGTPLAEHDGPSRRALAGESVSALDLLLVREDGPRVEVRVSAAPIRDVAGSVEGAVVAFEEASAPAEAHRRTEQWIAMVAHDLRQPLSVMQLCFQLLERAGTGAVLENERILQRTRTAMAQLDRMIGDLLDAARAGAGQLRIARAPTDVAALAREVADRVAAVEHANVRVTAPETPRVVAVDASRVEQLLANLIGNAAKYGTPGAPIDVSVDGAPPFVEITVDNDGPPIADADRARLFSRFFRAEATPHRGGTGLGLYICKAIAEAHGGDIAALRTSEGRTRFRVRLSG
jgi:PAS domain S-box-containing protein